MKQLWQHGIRRLPVIFDFPMVRVWRLLLLYVTENAPGAVRSANQPCYKEEKRGKITVCLRAKTKAMRTRGPCCANEVVGQW